MRPAGADWWRESHHRPTHPALVAAVALLGACPGGGGETHETGGITLQWYALDGMEIRIEPDGRLEDGVFFEPLTLADAIERTLSNTRPVLHRRCTTVVPTTVRPLHRRCSTAPRTARCNAVQRFSATKAGIPCEGTSTPERP